MAKWQPTQVFLPGKFHGRRSLVGYCPWDRKESDTTKRREDPSLNFLNYPLLVSNFPSVSSLLSAFTELKRVGFLLSVHESFPARILEVSMKSRLTGKDPDAGKDGEQVEEGTTEDEMVGWHH